MDYGYQVKLAADACATMDLNLNGEIIPADTVHKAFIAALDGVFAAIVFSHEICYCSWCIKFSSISC